MEIQSQQKKRAQNVIWNASEDYTFQPGFEVFDGRGEVDLYWNFVIGAVHKYYDYGKLAEFFNYVKQDSDCPFYEELTWIGLESCVYEKGRRDRPILQNLRRLVSEKVLCNEYPESFYYLIDELRKAHFQRALGIEPQMSEQVAEILGELEFDESLTTEEIILRLHQIIAKYFPLKITAKKKKFLIPIPFIKKNLHFQENEFFRRFRKPFTDFPFFSFLVKRSKKSGTEQAAGGNTAIPLKMHGAWRNLQERSENKVREIIQNRYGLSILVETQTRTLEQVLCTGNHKGCHLHFTRGEFDPKSESAYKKALLKQNVKNRSHFKRNASRNSNSINQLTNIIKNTMLIQFEPSTYRAETGQMMAGRVWRSLYLDDSSIFLKTTRDDIGTLSVDILLDASGSQIDRQEILSSEGYIIAESLKRSHIPVRVLSFCTNGNFTVLNLFRDYDEENKNDQIFSYHASGCNRDGLALRTALHLMAKTHYDHKLLIVLSDGKPIDPHGISTGGSDPDLNFYSDKVGVNDAAFEVRKGRQNGISILCVFTGQDEDLPAAKKVYGNDLVCIKSPEKFADIVGVLLKNELRNI